MFQEVFDSAPDLYVQVLDPSGERQLLSTRDAVRRRAGRDSWFELELPPGRLAAQKPT